MAFVMNWTDPRTGASYPESVWYPPELYIDHATHTGRVAFRGWADLSALAAGKEAVGRKEYYFDGKEYAQLVMSPVDPADGVVLAAVVRAMYALALSRLDTPAADGDEKKVSFFDGAAEVTLPG